MTDEQKIYNVRMVKGPKVFNKRPLRHKDENCWNNELDTTGSYSSLEMLYA